jgi:hypothetical protein
MTRVDPRLMDSERLPCSGSGSIGGFRLRAASTWRANALTASIAWSRASARTPSIAFESAPVMVAIGSGVVSVVAWSSERENVRRMVKPP